ncbi:hypothetical protein F8A86_14410 [Betaproteobacteria bacterium SCN1]|jgi:hypothetical protein|nr:hypothetical protein F8A86_14410 [Betaproteobacteria bacterium SCN1]
MNIAFFRSALNSKDEAYKARLMRVTVPDGVPEGEAVAGAIKQFQEHMKVSHWQELAEFYEVT